MARDTIRKHLLVFSIAAPIGAMLTYGVLYLAGRGSEEELKTRTGLLLLFSAGTFLYVSTVHILPEIYHEEEEIDDVETPMILAMDEIGRGRRPSDLVEGTPSKARRPSNTIGHGHKTKVLSRSQIIILVIGIFSPLVFSFGHHH
jgi:hypothetical protein